MMIFVLGALGFALIAICIYVYWAVREVGRAIDAVTNHDKT